MARNKQQFTCQSCGTSYARWAGRCETCDGWNTITEETQVETVPKGLGKHKGQKIQFTSLKEGNGEQSRFPTGVNELDRVFGGGLVPGSAVLLAGDPGIGKSTLLLQGMAALSMQNKSVTYISGEEGPEQIRLRAKRLGLNETPVRLAAATNVRDILTSLEENPTNVIAIDSIQTAFLDNLDSAPGTVSQVRGSAQELIRYAKRSNSVLLLIGHVTKDGQIAGPRVLEHMVDTVLYFEGDRGHRFRIVRSIKNRFGPTDEIGVFEMTDRGLIEVTNPSSLFIDAERGAVPGTAIYAGIEGTRTMLMEIQALVTPGPPGSPRRSVVGWDTNRLAMILAVLEANVGLSLSTNDVYLNVTGGLRITEPAADMAVAAAIISSANTTPVPKGTVIFGEIGLSGEARPVAQSESRLREAEKLGFEKSFLPLNSLKVNRSSASKIEIKTVKQISDLITLIGVSNSKKPIQ